MASLIVRIGTHANVPTKEHAVARARILVADDHEGIRQTVVQLLRREFDVLEPVNDGQSLVEAVDRLKPDLCVVDISMPVLSGIQAASILKRIKPPPKLIFLTIHDDEDFVREALNTGAEGYVIKERMASDLVFAVKTVLGGQTFISKLASSN
jgi:DNA-binding NarL/FixJ family response regulator